MSASADAAAERRPFARLAQRAGLVLSASLAVLTLWVVLVGQFTPQEQRGAFLLAAGLAAFALWPTNPSWARSPRAALRWLDGLVSLTAAALLAFSVIYYLRNYSDIAIWREGIPDEWDLACYAAGMVAVLEGIRRTEGGALAYVILGVILYLFVGDLIPGLLGHQGLRLSHFLETGYGLGGMFGVALGVVTSTIYVFVLYGAVMRSTGAGKVFIDLAFSLTGKWRGGPAQAAVVSSALFGTISGSGPANVVATGTFTIPLMKRAGFRADFAGGVEAVASSVGQIMPPVMGVAVFIMAEITGIPYATIMVAALMPALLYILALIIAVWLRAEADDLPRLAESEIPRLGRAEVPLLLVLLASIATILAVVLWGRTPDFAGAAGAAVLLAGSLLLPGRPGPRQLLTMLVEGGRDGVSLTIACAGIGIIIAGLSSTGLGIKLTQAIVAVGAGNLLLAAALAAACCLVIGMGLPTAASYLMVVYVAAPALTALGVPLLSAHLFVFYFAVLSAITPPVAICAFAAAGISGASPLATGVQAVRIGAVAFVLPFAWLYNPGLLLVGSSASDAAWAILSAVAMVIALTAAAMGHLGAPLSPLARLLLAGAAIAAVGGPDWLRLLAFGLIAAIAFGAHRTRRAAVPG